MIDVEIRLLTAQKYPENTHIGILRSTAIYFEMSESKIQLLK